MSNPINKNNINTNKSIVQKNNAVKPTLSSKQIKSPRAARVTAPGQSSYTNQNINNLSSTLSKSKYTERKQLLVTPARSRSFQQAINNSSAATKISSAKAEKPSIPAPPKHTPKIWNRKEMQKDLKPSNTKSNEKLELSPRPLLETGIQTNEGEILNRDLLIGDIKFLMPSKIVMENIERDREEAKKRAMIKMQRKFEEHSERQEEHLTDLQEFLDKAVITKRNRKSKDAIMVDKKLISSMDNIFKRELPRAESITDIKGRIKRKEKELLSLFDTVENVQKLSNTN